MSYSDIMNLWFYDLQNILQTYQTMLENRKKAEEDEAKRQGYDPNNMNPNSMMKNMNGMMKNSMPKMPNMSGFKL